MPAGCLGEVRVDVALELGEQRRELVLVDDVEVGQRRRRRASAPAATRAATACSVMASVSGEPVSNRHTPMRAPASALGVEGVLGRLIGRDRTRGGIVRVEALQHGERQRGVDDVAGHRAGRVLLGRDRHHPGARDQPEGGLVPHDAVGAGRAHDRAVGLGADRHLGERRGDTGARARRRAARVAVEHVGVGGQPADRAPPARRVRAAEVGPLRQVRLAEDHGAGGPEPLDQTGVVGRAAAQQRPRPGGGRHQPPGAVSMLSLRRTGTPSSGLRGPRK